MSNIEMSPNIVQKIDGTICCLEITRRNKKNALDYQMYVTLTEYLQIADQDPKITVIYLHGQEDMFTSGNDLKELALLTTDDKYRVAPFEFLNTIAALNKPLVAAVGGDAVGIGSTALLHCDFAVASSNARFMMPFINLGACPEGASSLLLPISAGQKLANEILLLGDFFDAEKALRAGMINEICKPEDLLKRGFEICQRLAAKPQDALRTSKSLIKGNFEEEVQRILEVEYNEFIRLLGTPAAIEIVSAFIEKRPPNQAVFNQPEIES
jgi:enoyl-CoA hydratase/carnithine racemase